MQILHHALAHDAAELCRFTLTEKNQSLNKALLAECLAKAFDAYSPIPASSDDINYPQPEEPHPVDLEALANKQRWVNSQVGDTPIWALGHGYGPVEDFKNRAQAAFRASKNRLWINRYAYLANEKFDALAAKCSSGAIALP